MYSVCECLVRMLPKYIIIEALIMRYNLDQFDFYIFMLFVGWMRGGGGRGKCEEHRFNIKWMEYIRYRRVNTKIQPYGLICLIVSKCRSRRDFLNITFETIGWTYHMVLFQIYAKPQSTKWSYNIKSWQNASKQINMSLHIWIHWFCVMRSTGPVSCVSVSHDSDYRYSFTTSFIFFAYFA